MIDLDKLTKEKFAGADWEYSDEASYNSVCNQFHVGFVKPSYGDNPQFIAWEDAHLITLGCEIEKVKAKLEVMRHTEAWCNGNDCQSSKHVLLTFNADNPQVAMDKLEQQLAELEKMKEEL